MHSAEGWEELLLPEIERQQRMGKEVAFRGDAVFARPEIYEALEERGVKCAIRMPANENLERDVAELLPRPVGRPSVKPLAEYKGFLYQAASCKTARRVVAKVEHHAGELFPRSQPDSAPHRGSKQVTGKRGDGAVSEKSIGKRRFGSLRAQRRQIWPPSLGCRSRSGWKGRKRRPQRRRLGVEWMPGRMARRKPWLNEPIGNHKERKQVLALPSQGRCSMCSLVTPIRISLQNILVATDFSSCSETALSYAIGMSRRYGATLYTVSVVPAEISDDVQPPDPFYLRHSAENKMANLVKSDLFQGIKHHELVKEGSGFISEVLSELIGRLETDLIVLGTHGRGGIKKLVLGSVAEEIADFAYCPVLTVGPHISSKLGPELKLRRILYATDLLPGSARALTYALRLVEHEHAHLTLLHVLKMPSDVPSGYPEAERDTAMKRLVELLPPETTLSVETEFIVEIGAPTEHILKVAEDQGADLIVMGPHHTSHPGVSAHLPWVTLHQVLCRARCPVLTVRD